MRVFFLFILLSNFHSFGQKSYSDSLTAVREQHQIDLLQSKNSPLIAAEIQQIAQLDYYPADEQHIVEATFKKKTGKAFDLPTSSGKSKKYRKYGEVFFMWNGKTVKLNVYQDLTLMQMPQYKDYLIIPFKDATSGTETYGGGRYLDLRITNSKNIRLDLNTAYNPYCAYSYRFNCPIPPVENHLNIPINAGEKTPLVKH